MGDSKGKTTPKKSTPNKPDKTKSPANKVKSNSKVENSVDKNKKSPIKESLVPKKTPTKSSAVENKTPVKTDKKTPVKEQMKIPNKEIKKTPSKEQVIEKNTTQESSETKKKLIDMKVMSRKREGLPLSRVRTIMKTARYAEAISPDAVSLTAIATEAFIKYLIKSVHNLAITDKKKKIDYSVLAKHVNDKKEEHLEFLRVLIPHKISVAKYKKLLAENSKNSDRLDFLASESEESESGSEEESEDESGEEEESSDSDIQEIPTPSKSTKPAPKTTASPKQPTKKVGKVQTVDLCESSSEDDFIIVDQKKNQGKGVKVL